MSRKHHIILIRIICAAVMMASGLVLNSFPLLSFAAPFLFAAAAITVGFDVLIGAFNGIIHGHMLDENFLMSIGSICAFALGEYAEGTFILLFYQVGELFQGVAVGKSRKSIASLMDIRPDTARVLRNGQFITVDPYDVSVGDIILVEPSEKIALDGVIIKGASSLDLSSLTGESMPLDVAKGCEVLSGSINLISPIEIKVTKEFEQSTAAKILELVENASSKKAKTESFVRSFAKYYTPLVVLAAILVAAIPPLFFNGSLEVWLIRAVMFIVISCPCALVVSVPLAFFGALGGASRIGILVKGSNYLEALAKADTFIFDKTGTLTTGSLSISELCPEENVSPERLLETAALLELHSSHPIAIAIKKHYGKELSSGGRYENISGKGIRLDLNGKTLLAGNSVLLREHGYEIKDVKSALIAIHIADGEYLGYILISDNVKPMAKDTLANLKRLGIKKTVMLTGDRNNTAKEVAEELGIDEVRAELLPADKVFATEEFIEKGGKVVFVGDGVNDAPVISRADVGIAMGSLGSDAAIEAADIVIMNDDLSLLPKGIKIARKALSISKQNIAFSLIVKFSFLFLSLIGYSTVWMAVFADVGVLIIAILNSMRTLKKQ